MMMMMMRIPGKMIIRADAAVVVVLVM